MSDRPKGVVVYRSPVNAVAVAAKQHQKQLQEQKREAAAKRAARPVPNYLCYPEAFKGRVDENGNWLGGLLPKCRVCEDILPPKENHVCSGFKPKYVEHDEDWQERQAAKREEIRAAKRHRVITCSGCDAEIHDLEEALWHDEHCEADRVRERRAINDDDDDLSGYEDEPEEDYCEGDDDGYYCD
jgi:hypothetical protein